MDENVADSLNCVVGLLRSGKTEVVSGIEAMRRISAYEFPHVWEREYEDDMNTLEPCVFFRKSLW